MATEERRPKSVLHKPRVLYKMAAYQKRAKQGEYALQLLELNYNNQCNFRCEHCFSRFLSDGSRRLGHDDVSNLAGQADALGVWQWHLQGGEPLLWPDLDEVIAAIGPERFHIMITTNGFLMTPDKARALADQGIDKIAVSLDSIDPNAHDGFRYQKGSHAKAIEAMRHAKEAGLQVNVNTVITRQNAHSQDVLDIVRFAEDNGYTVLFVIATSAGAWAGKTDMLITPEDAAYLLELHQSHPVIHRDLYPLFDFPMGCRTMNGLVYITENGNLLPCPFIHIAMGNVLDEPLDRILQRGWRVKRFRDYSPICLAGEDREFINRFMAPMAGRVGPMPFDEAFSDEDLYDV